MIEKIWAVVSDPTRVGEWSHETTGCSWVDGADHARVGARFAGTNKSGAFKWTRKCEITSFDDQRTIAWRTIPAGPYRDSTIWTIALEPVDEGTRITESFQMVKLSPVMSRFLWAVMPPHRDRTEALRQDLIRLGDTVIGGGGRGSDE